MNPITYNTIIKPYGGKIKSVIFDLGGTLVDPFVISPAISFIQAFKEYGFRITPQEARGPMGIRKDLHIESILSDVDVKKRWIEEFKREPNKEDYDEIYNNYKCLQHTILPDYCSMINGAEKTISILRKDYQLKLGITTGFDRKMVDIILNNNKKLKVDSVVAGDDLIDELGSRPKPFMIWKNLFQMKIPHIQSVIKVDDTVSGIEEGLNAGCWTIGVANYSNYMNVNSMDEYNKLLPDELDAKRKEAKRILMFSGAHYVIDDLSLLPQTIDKINYHMLNQSVY